MAAVSWPLVRKELRQSLRARATLLVENLYLLILVVVAGWSVYSATHGCSVEPTWKCGRDTFWQVAHMQAILLGLVAAALSAAAVTAEQEQKTGDLLLVTPARVREIVRSKFIAFFVIAVVFVLLSIPVSVLCLLLGGLTWWELALAYLVTATWLGLAGAVGVLSGAMVRRTIAAVPLAIVLVFIVNLISSGLAYGRLPHAVLGGSGALSLISNETPLSFFHFQLPIWAAALLLCLPVMACLVESAVDRVRLAHHRSPVSQRIWMFVSAVSASALALGKVAANPQPPSRPPWEALGSALFVQGAILFVVAAVFASQGLSKRDHAAFRGERQPVLHALFGAGPRAGARMVMLLGVVVLVGWAVFWPLVRAEVGVPPWRIALAVANVVAGIWVACLLAQTAAFWGRLRREWARRVVGLLLVALLFAAVPGAAGIIQHGQGSPPPVSTLLLLTNPGVGCYAAFDPAGTIPGSGLAEDLDQVVPLGLYPLWFSLALGLLLAVVLWRGRRRLQKVLMEGKPPAPREVEAAFRSVE